MQDDLLLVLHFAIGELDSRTAPLSLKRNLASFAALDTYPLPSTSLWVTWTTRSSICRGKRKVCMILMCFGGQWWCFFCGDYDAFEQIGETRRPDLASLQECALEPFCVIDWQRSPRVKIRNTRSPIAWPLDGASYVIED